MKWFFFIMVLLAVYGSSSCEAKVGKLECKVKKLEQEKRNTEVKEKERLRRRKYPSNASNGI